MVETILLWSVNCSTRPYYSTVFYNVHVSMTSPRRP